MEIALFRHNLLRLLCSGRSRLPTRKLHERACEMAIVFMETIRKILGRTLVCPVCRHRQVVPKDRSAACLRCEKCCAQINGSGKGQEKKKS